MKNKLDYMTRLDRLASLDAQTVYAASPDVWSLPGYIQQKSGTRVTGVALTVCLPPGDNLASHQAIAKAELGTLFVASVSENQPGGYFGEIMAVACQVKDIRGLVIDGTVRDLDEIRQLGLPVFATGTALDDTSKTGAEGFGLRGEIKFGSQKLKDGDYVFGDASGIVVVPANNIGEALQAAEQRALRESEMISAIRAGRSTLDILGLKAN